MQPGAEFGAVKFSPDGSRLYASGFGPTIVIDTASGDELPRIPGNGILAVSPDGRRIATADADGAIITWDLGDWSAGFRTSMFARQTASVELDERTVGLEHSYGMTQVIVADPAAWTERACQVAGRALTEEEWGKLLGARPYAPACRG